MAKSLLLSLIGEQPIPILLIDRYLKPSCHFLVHTDRTKGVAEKIDAMLPHTNLLPLKNAYDLAGIRREFEQKYQPSMVLNLTSGTKPMAWAGYDLARQHRGKVVYLQSEGKQSILYEIDFADDKIPLQKECVLPQLIDIKDYFQAHGLPTPTPGQAANDQEKAIEKFLRERTDECIPNAQFDSFEIDFIIRRGNQIAIIEAKDTAKTGRKGIDQLTTIAGREYLGAYTGRILAVKNEPEEQHKELAQAYRIEIVTISYEGSGEEVELTTQSKQDLNAILDKVLGGPNCR